MREVVLDTETTGTDSQTDRIVEIGCVVLKDYLPTGEEFQSYVNPCRLVGEEAQKIHGLSNGFLSKQPQFGEVVGDFLSFLGGDPLIIHNASFDMGFLNAELKRISEPPLSNVVVDTLELARRLYPGKSNSLQNLCRRLGIDTRARQKHGALVDAHLLAHVYLRLCGGRQMGMGFLSEPSQKQAYAKKSSVVPVAPLSFEERAAHDGLVKILGKRALWHRYLGGSGG